jgi:hypothetical protein
MARRPTVLKWARIPVANVQFPRIALGTPCRQLSVGAGMKEHAVAEGSMCDIAQTLARWVIMLDLAMAPLSM